MEQSTPRTVVKGRRPNPNWNKPSLQLPARLTHFEHLLQQHQLSHCSRRAIASRVVVRTWVQTHYHRYYVPEWLLKWYGLQPNDVLGLG